MLPATLSLFLAALPTGQTPDFAREVRPILAEHCYACHGPDGAARKGGLRLDDPEGIDRIREGDRLSSRIDSPHPDEVMPPPETKNPLSDEEKATLRAWVAAGAPTARHWAFVAPTRPTHAGGLSRIDELVRARLEGTGLAPAEEAEPAVLLRRLHLDLVGLPPSPEEVDLFVEAHRSAPDQAVEEVTDSLLASPAFGEHWARPWLDLARYADSNGYQADQLRPSWAFRDWVIRSINANQPFDEFTIDQLAGDLLPDPSLDQRIATGFHRAAPCNVEAGVHPEENRTLQVMDRVNTTSTVWLGLTMECAQCHDHKYDPFTTREYYELYAYFNRTPLEVELPSGTTDVSHDFVGPYMDLPLGEGLAAERARLVERREDLEQAREQRIRSGLQPWTVRAREALTGAPLWQVLTPTSFDTGGGGETHPLEDGSTLLTGAVPDRAVYTIEIQLGDRPLSMVRLEALTHEELPGRGPGRGDPERRNFVLNEVEVLIDGQAVGLGEPMASFEQSGWPASGAVDGDLDTGWAIAPRFGESHELSLGLEEPKHGSRLTIVLHQNYGQGRVIGRLRVSGSTASPDLRGIGDTERELLLGQTAPVESDGDPLEAAFARVDGEVRELDGELAEVRGALDRIRPDRTLVMREEASPRTTHVLERGHYLSPGEPVEPGTPAALHAPGSEAPANRLGLARWIVDPANPLTARVVVNRWWAELFGSGLVETAEDFGLQSTPPSHPELLDWLALELVESGWDRKHLLRSIVTSATYRQDSRIDGTGLALDPKNRLLARGPRVRLSAETLRDQALAASGLLSSERFGPPVMPYQPPGVWRAVGRGAPTWNEARDEQRYRRGIYVVWRRAAPYPSFVTFDAPDRASCTVSRSRTNTPLQALALLNDPVQLEAALALADLSLSDEPGDPLRHIFRRVLVRDPEQSELELLAELREDRLADYRREPARADALIEGVRGVIEPTCADAPLLAACFHVAHVVLNLDEAVTKE